MVDFWRVLVVCVLLTLTVNILVRLLCSIGGMTSISGDCYREKTRNEYSGSERISTRASRVLIQWEKYLRKTVFPNIADIPKTGSR